MFNGEYALCIVELKIHRHFKNMFSLVSECIFLQLFFVSVSVKEIYGLFQCRDLVLSFFVCRRSIETIAHTLPAAHDNYLLDGVQIINHAYL